MIGSPDGQRPWPSVDDVVEAYESDRAGGGRVDIAEFLPGAGHPEYLAILCELIRVDLEYSWQDRRPNRLDHYRERFPELFGDSRWVQEIAFEEFRLRRQAGEDPSPLEYRRRFGAHTLDWPSSFLDSLEGDSEGAAPDRGRPLPLSDPGPIEDSVASAAAAYRDFRQRAPGSPEGLGALFASRQVPRESAELFGDLDHADPKAADRLALAVVSFPRPGSMFLGFRLERELGRGAFGRVYLARQGDLANRPVALKIASDMIGETHALAQLQHTNIVPIYSVHRSGPFQAVCMPYLGSSTLADVLHELKQHPTLPDSGAGLLSTHHRRVPTAEPRPASAHQDGGAAPAGDGEAEAGPTVGTDPGPASREARADPRAARATAQVERLRGLGYVQAVLWLAARAADGLAHAHERGILHRDLKPANILLGDDGEPLLLDFNLAVDTKLRGHASAALIGGTLPYMAPEQLEAFRTGDRGLDARSDLYSLGVILFELLTGRPPFPIHSGADREILRRMIAERNGPPPMLRPWNPKISPAAETILRRCLHHDPAQRYQSARDLNDDLQRQLDDLPLKHTPEPSLRERLAKWSRRHKRLTSMTTLGVIAACLLTAVTAGFLARQRHVARLEAADSSRRLTAEVRQADFLLGSRDATPQQIEEGVTLCHQVLRRYGVLDDPSWSARPMVILLMAEQRDRLRQEIGQLLLLHARAAIWQAEATADPARRSERVGLASRLNTLAGSCFGEAAPSRALWLQRSDLAQLVGRDDEARRLRETAAAVPLRTPMDRFWDVIDQLDRGGRRELTTLPKRREIMATLQEISRHDPQNFVNYLLLGNCYVRLGQLDAAVSCYSAGIALRPDLPWSYVNRGLAHLDLKEYSDAVADFDQALALRPDMVESYLNRALARMGIRDFAGAVADLGRALEHRDAPVRALFLRAQAREQLGDREGAAQDRAEGLRRRPDDELSWVVRGLARLNSDPLGALTDFDAALALNPRSKSALQDKAHVLAEKLGRTEEAIQALSTALRHHPDYVDALAARGVYHARLGRRDPALTDARAALALSDRAGTIYQVAGIYALTSKQQPDDRREALRLLASALRTDPSWLRVVPDDHELDPLRDRPEFRDLLIAVAKVSEAAVPVQPNSSKERN
jgi:serine/threonine protein kinase/tetratricopeptide (TPR) repeat protein